MGYCYCYRCQSANSGPLPYPVVLFLIITFVSIGLSKSLAFEALYEALEMNINFGLLALPVIILAAVHFLSSMDARRRKFYGPVGPYY